MFSKKRKLVLERKEAESPLDVDSIVKRMHRILKSSGISLEDYVACWKKPVEYVDKEFIMAAEAVPKGLPVFVDLEGNLRMEKSAFLIIDDPIPSIREEGEECQFLVDIEKFKEHCSCWEVIK